MKSHRTDSVSLFFGLLFLLVAFGFLAGSYLDFGLPHIGWFVAVGLILLGLAAGVSALMPPRPRPADNIASEPADRPAGEPAHDRGTEPVAATAGAAESAQTTHPVPRPAEDRPSDGPMLAE